MVSQETLRFSFGGKFREIQSFHVFRSFYELGGPETASLAFSEQWLNFVRRVENLAGQENIPRFFGAKGRQCLILLSFSEILCNLTGF